MEQPALQPFACSYTPNVPELLQKLGCTISISTYQAGKVVFLSPKDQNRLVQLPRTFDKPMGIALSGEKMAIATKDSISVYANSADLAQHYPKSPNTYDALYLPRVTYHTNALDVHDLEFGKEGKLFAVNTLFSCVISLDDQYNFTPYWKPSFISELASEDRCHLNGMAMKDGKPKYVSAFNKGNTPQSWRGKIEESGILIDVESDQIIAEGLAMPHTPRFWNNKIYILQSAQGSLLEIDPQTGVKNEIVRVNSFVRGMDLHGEFLFIGTSKLRTQSNTFSKLVDNFSENFAGITIVHLPTKAIVGRIQYHNSVEEIYDVKVIPNKIRPNILGVNHPEAMRAVSIPGQNYWAPEEN